MKERTMFAELDEAEPSIMRILMFHFIKLPRTMIQFFWFQSKRFRDASCPIVERLASSLMMHGRNNGKEASLTMLGRAVHGEQGVEHERKPVVSYFFSFSVLLHIR